MDDSCCTMEHVIKDNLTMLRQAQNYDVPYLLIDDKYQIDLDLFQQHKAKQMLGFVALFLHKFSIHEDHGNSV